MSEPVRVMDVVLAITGEPPPMDWSEVQDNWTHLPLGDDLTAERPPLPEGEPMGIEDIRDALIIRERDLFLLTNPSGNVPPDNRQGFGFYHADTRHLSVYDFSFGLDAGARLRLGGFYAEGGYVFGLGSLTSFPRFGLGFSFPIVK